MNYLQHKKRAFISILNAAKGILKTVTGVSSLIMPDCVDNESLSSLSITGNTGGVGDYDGSKYKISITVSGLNEYDLNSVLLTNATLSGNTITATTASPFADLLLPAGKYSISFKKSSGFQVFVVNGRVPSGNVIATINGSFASFTYNASQDGYLRLKWFANGSSLTNIMLVKGTYIQSEMPEYEEYVTPQIKSITLNNALTETDILTMNYNESTATVNGTDVTSEIDWNTVPQTIEGTTLLTATTSILPSAMSGSYYATK